MSDRIDQPISVSSDRLLPLLEQACAAGINVRDMLQSIDLDPDLANPSNNMSISLADYFRVKNRLAILFDDETTHLSSRQLLRGSTDFVLQHLEGASNLFETMQIIARSYNMLHGGEYNSVSLEQGTVDYVIDDESFSYAADLALEHQYFAMESILIRLHCMLMIVSPLAETAVRGVHLKRPPPHQTHSHLSYWQAPIKFGVDAYKICVDRSIAQKKILVPPAEALTFDAVHHKILDAVTGKRLRFDQRHTVSGRVREALSRGGVLEQHDVAAQMGVSVATLRRHLSHEGVSFRELRREVLNETAKRLLLEHHPVVEVSEALGFSEFRAFNRAFKDWNGMTPTAFVRQCEAV